MRAGGRTHRTLARAVELAQQAQRVVVLMASEREATVARLRLGSLGDVAPGQVVVGVVAAVDPPGPVEPGWIVLWDHRAREVALRRAQDDATWCAWRLARARRLAEELAALEVES